MSSKQQRPLKERMKTSELYIVFCGLDGFSIRFIGYGDGTPRIYSKETLDDRICDQLRICESVETASKCIGPETYAVVLPLSELITFCGEYEVKRWAGPQHSVSPKEVREYVSKWLASRSIKSSHYDAAAQDFLTKQIVFDHGLWIAANPNGTLEDLLEFLESVRTEMLRYDEEELIADHIDDLEIAAEYLDGFGDPNEPLDDDGELPTFGYRFENVDEDLQNVDDLIELVGESSEVAELSSLEDAVKPSSLALAG